MSWQPSPSPGLDYFHCIPGHSRAASLTALPSTSFVTGKLGNGPTDGFVFLAWQDAHEQKKFCISSLCPLPNAVIGFRVSWISLCPTKRITHNWNKEFRKKRYSCQKVGWSGPLYSHPGSIAYYLLSLSLLFSKVGIHRGFAEQLQLRWCSWALALRKNIL